jgi:hypothetical protein
MVMRLTSFFRYCGVVNDPLFSTFLTPFESQVYVVETMPARPTLRQGGRVRFKMV